MLGSARPRPLPADTVGQVKVQSAAEKHATTGGGSGMCWNLVCLMCYSLQELMECSQREMPEIAVRLKLFFSVPYCPVWLVQVSLPLTLVTPRDPT